MERIDREQAIRLAAEALHIEEEAARTHCKPVPEADAWYVWDSRRGGASVIVDTQGEKLAATSAVGFERHLAAFLAGKRN